jgi:hypothetical protein
MPARAFPMQILAARQTASRKTSAFQLARELQHAAKPWPGLNLCVGAAIPKRRQGGLEYYIGKSCSRVFRR